VERTLHIHDHRDPQGPVTVQRLAVVSAIAASRYRYFQVEHVALHNGVGGSLAEPPEDRFRSRLRIALDSFRYRVHRHVDYLLRYRDLLWRDLRKERSGLVFLAKVYVVARKRGTTFDDFLRYRK